MYMPCTCSPGNFFLSKLDLTGTAYRIVRVHSDKRWNHDLSLFLLGCPRVGTCFGIGVYRYSQLLLRARSVSGRGGELGGAGGLKAHAGILIRTALAILQGCSVDCKMRYTTK